MTLVRHSRPVRSHPVLTLFASLVASVLGTTVALLVGAWPAVANEPPTSIGIEGDGLPEPIVVHADTQGKLFTALLRQVDWMAGAAGVPIHPDPATLGPQLTVTVYTQGKATGVYQLYPLAPGGPRAFRPADQPTRDADDAWFYANVAMADTLRAAGVPLVDPSASPDVGHNDPAGYLAAPAPSTPAALRLHPSLDGHRTTMLAWGGTAVLLVLLVLGAALYSHRVRHPRVAVPPVPVGAVRRRRAAIQAGTVPGGRPPTPGDHTTPPGSGG